MRVDVIGPILRVVLQHEDHRVLPEGTLRQRLDDPPQCEIVVRHVRSRRWLAGSRTGRVIIRQVKYLQRWQLPRSHEFMKLSDPEVGARLIGYVEVPSRVRGVDVAEESGFGCNS